MAVTSIYRRTSLTVTMIFATLSGQLIGEILYSLPVCAVADALFTIRQDSGAET